jgi:hypothetical protein
VILVCVQPPSGPWAAEEPVRLKLLQFGKLFSGQKVTPSIIHRALRLGLVSVDGLDIVVRSPKFLEIGAELTRMGIPLNEILDEFERLQSMTETIAGRFTGVFERHLWDPFLAAGLPDDQIRPLTESLRQLSMLAESVVEIALRDALRRKASEFLAGQASRLDEATVRDGLRPAARAAGLDV